jgi:predicted house-cleaning noncanonical NTP pyrophosphatase (MazG superfamily)
MLYLESFRDYTKNLVSKLKGKWKDIDSLLKRNFTDVFYSDMLRPPRLYGKSMRKKVKSHVWAIPMVEDQIKYVVQIEYYPSNDKIIILLIKTNDDPKIVITRNHYDCDREFNFSYKEFFEKDWVNKIPEVVRNNSEDKKSRKQQSDLYDKYLKKMITELNESLPKEDLEDILSDIKDLSIATFEIELRYSSTDSGDDDEYLDEGSYYYYDVHFSINQDSDLLEEYSEFYKLIHIAMKRIQSTYDIRIKWNQRESRMILYPSNKNI